MRRFAVDVLLALFAVCSWVGCKGSSGGGAGSDSCGQVEPCGGNIVGTWKLSDACANSAALDSEVSSTSCPNTTASLASVTPTGSITFNSNMTYTITAAAIDVSLDIGIPAACLNGGSCAEVSAALQSELAGSSCSGTSSCTCNATETSYLSPSSTNDDSGTYTISGETVILTSSDANGDTSTMDYCVQGNDLHFVAIDTTMNTGPMGQATIDSDVVATKQ
ncbi:MAG TPA: hypothetical protein VEK07_20135 [Polyangiaceae bacterium]|nr:hypothetical protein [Polyangiaceae bacterium]